jgi:hypothetical protein
MQRPSAKFRCDGPLALSVLRLRRYGRSFPGLSRRHKREAAYFSFSAFALICVSQTAVVADACLKTDVPRK